MLAIAFGKRARLGAPRVGRVRMATAAPGPCTPRKSPANPTVHPYKGGGPNRLVATEQQVWYPRRSASRRGHRLQLNRLHSDFEGGNN